MDLFGTAQIFSTVCNQMALKLTKKQLKGCIRIIIHNRDPGQKPAFPKHHHPTLIMARADKSALVDKAVSAIKRGEFTDYSKAATKYGCDRTTISRRIRGLTKTRKEATLFFHKALTDT
jgi:DNA invertase Pin-like site-specific DNA recombinase